MLAPEKYNNYHELFLGCGALFFKIRPTKRIFLNDLNSDLINTYKQVRDNPGRLIANLKKAKNTREDYYKIRASKPHGKISQAGRFIYLNRTCFNGIYRVSPKGNFNVPYGNRKSVDIVTSMKIRAASSALKFCELSSEHFSRRLRYIKNKDYVFLDPPYTVTHNNNGFVSYNSKLFSTEDQLNLVIFIEKLIRRGAYFMLTNADHPVIRDLYGSLGEIVSIGRKSIVGGRLHTRGQFREIIVRNF